MNNKVKKYIEKQFNIAQKTGYMFKHSIINMGTQSESAVEYKSKIQGVSKLNASSRKLIERFVIALAVKRLNKNEIESSKFEIEFNLDNNDIEELKRLQLNEYKNATLEDDLMKIKNNVKNIKVIIEFNDEYIINLL